MERSLLAAVSGINSDQTWLDVIGNNIANDDTTGYKSNSVVFDDLLAQQVAGASAATATQAGINAIAVGSGVRVGAVNTNFAEGALNQTGNSNDVAIQGNGFLVANQNGQQLFTRDGTLTVDANGNLASPTGGLIQGWQAVNGVLNTNAPIGNITIPVGAQIPPQQTKNITMGGNLNANDPVGTTVTTTVTAYDSLGDAVPITLTFKLASTATTGNTWDLTGTAAIAPSFGGGTANLWAGAQTLTFTPSGQLADINGAAVSTTAPTDLPTTGLDAANGFPVAPNVVFDQPGSPGAVTQFAAQDSAEVTNQDGYASGTLAGFTIGDTGVITGNYTNDQSQTIGQLAMSVFTNPNGLTQTGNNDFLATANSGPALIGTGGTGGRGTLVDGALESSNVNLGRQLTYLVEAQTDYQANTKTVASTSLVLQALINMP